MHRCYRGCYRRCVHDLSEVLRRSLRITIDRTSGNEAERMQWRSRRVALLAVFELAVLLQRAPVTVGAGADEAAVAGFLHGLLEIGEQSVEVVFGPGLLDLVERVVD